MCDWMRLSIFAFQSRRGPKRLADENEAPTMNGATASDIIVRVPSNCAIKKTISSIVSRAWRGVKKSVSTT